ncbi:unnamed protein product [[Candida] boidinii]|uniref:Unnamed protein product n=1 Tax=Candida boidinii TaxID=5477 RepID=A0A9W6W8I5_CANBO|nr:hypothetical protein BVG19_g3795 [[Candida] boidinii]OWB50514.1 hypothetical protein B5S27_g2064 [[Candida] boidinii]OWB66026.1 hypothetical protein B5S30_g1360 [[Candida] boidinii]GME68269.1 unnamed protein product [[Candida] boidinii]GMF65757.1 unnamed protein product [[Candida] boidinii]
MDKEIALLVNQDICFSALNKPLSGSKDLLSQILHVDFEKESTIRTYKDGSKDYNFYSKGISVFTTISSGQDVVDSIDFYLIQSKSTSLMKVVTDDLNLPLDISREDTGQSLVEKFGEPLEKGGGMDKGAMNIWLRWNHFQVEINEKSWNSAQTSKVKSITIFKDK